MPAGYIVDKALFALSMWAVGLKAMVPLLTSDDRLFPLVRSHAELPSGN
jgi:type IV secretory pathway TrbD component